MTVIGDSVPEAVFRAIYSEMNPRVQLRASQLEGRIEFLSDEEGRRSTSANRGTLERPWELWKTSASDSSDKTGAKRHFVALAFCCDRDLAFFLC